MVMAGNSQQTCRRPQHEPWRVLQQEPVATADIPGAASTRMPATYKSQEITTKVARKHPEKPFAYCRNKTPYRHQQYLKNYVARDA